MADQLLVFVGVSAVVVLIVVAAVPHRWRLKAANETTGRPTSMKNAKTSSMSRA